MNENKTARKHFSKLGWMFVIGTIVIYAVQIGVSALILAVKPEWLQDPNISLLSSVIPLYLIGMPVLIFLIKRVPAAPVESHPMKPGQFVIAAIMCFGLVYLSNLLGNLITLAIGTLRGSMVENVIASIATSVNIWLVFGYMVLIAPFMEEYVFRKLIVDRTKQYGQGVAVLLSGLMFGLFHGNLNQFVYAFTLGAFLAFLYVKTGKLKIIIALHMMINFMGGVVSVQLLELLDLDEYTRAFSSGDTAVIMDYVNSNMLGIAAYGIYVLFIIGVMLAGLVLLIVALAKKRFVLTAGENVIPKGMKFRTVFVNSGIIAYCVVWVALIVYQLVA